MVEFWCLNAKCGNRDSVQIAIAIDKWGAGTSLVMLARRAKCQQCGRRGCHVQVTSRDSFGRYGWR